MKNVVKAISNFLSYQLRSVTGKVGNKRNTKIKQNAMVSLVIMVLSNLTAFILMPVVIGYLDVTKYGLWLTINSILAWIFLLDLGLSGGLRTRLAEALARKDIEDANILINTSYAFMGILMLVLSTAYYLISPFIDWRRLFNAPPDYAGELNQLMTVVVIFFFLRFALQIVNGMYTAVQRNSVSNLMNFATQLLSLVAILGFAGQIQGSLFWIGFIYSLSPLIVFALGTILFFRCFKQFKLSFRYIKLSALKRVLDIGIFEFIDQIAFIILMSATNFIIAHISSPAQVVPYHVTMRIFGIFLTVFTVATNPLTPAFTEAFTLDDHSWIKATFRKTNKLFFICSLGVLMMIPFSKPIFSFLVKGKAELSYMLVIIIAVTTLIRMYVSVFNKFLTGCGKVRLIAVTSLFSAFLYLFFVFVIGDYFDIGVNGVLASQLAVGLITAPVMIIQTHKVLKHKAKGIWAR